ncbi:MAG: nucleoside phosphorylase [Burkholderiales bacterium]|nr:nucleoside phosphorylase [Anaerolineae bacterium]
MTLAANYPILEHDSASEAFIEPSRVLRPIDIPEHVVLCFFREVVMHLGETAKLVTNLTSESGKHPIYETEIDGRRLAFAHPGVGAPFSAAFLEEVIALGGRKFIACGGSGALDANVTVGHVVIPTAAVRDEGTSYHYLPPSREVSASAEAIAAIEATLIAHEVPYVIGKTWTTDAIYRETVARIARRRDEGCITVEMEAAAFFAVAQFRGVTFGQLLYGGDDLSGSVWDHRDWIQSQASTREKLFQLAAEACLRL